MSDIIRLLPDSIANQIAAGEVIARPSNVVKELLENSIDAKAKSIEVFILEAGKKMIKVVDDGIGMSATDARMSLERHATSKLSEIDDLYKIKTMGFRGEALASIVSVAQVELKTIADNLDNNLGTLLEVEQSNVVRQENCAWNKGTSITVKNLFFNVPARRNFLKSAPVEIRHIVEEFTRTALAHPDIKFSITHNDTLLHKLSNGNYKYRIQQLFSKNYADNVMFHEEEMNDVKMKCFIGKPQIAKKSKASQYFFINNRFVRSPYFHHAVYSTYKHYLSADKQPFYVIFLDINPEKLDVNIHPTKQEIKVQDEKAIYSFISSAIRYLLTQYAVSSSIDFQTSKEINEIVHSMPSRPVVDKLGSNISKEYAQQNQTYSINKGNEQSELSAKIFYESLTSKSREEISKLPLDENQREDHPSDFNYIFLYDKYIICHSDKASICVSVKATYEEFLFKKYAHYTANDFPSQRVIFPERIDFSATEKIAFESSKDIFKYFGFNLESFGDNSYLIQSVPIDLMSNLPITDPQSEITYILHSLSEFDEKTEKNTKKDFLKTFIYSKSSLKKNWSDEDIKSLLTFLVDEKFPQKNFIGKTILTELQEHFFISLLK